jgi:uncharacterized cupin superfamily protein
MSDNSTRSLSEVIFTEEGKISEHGGITVKTFLDGEGAIKLTSGFAIYDPGARTGDDPTTHEGTEVVVGLEGTIVVEVDGKEYQIMPGNSLCFPGTKPHRGWNPGETTARALFLLY